MSQPPIVPPLKCQGIKTRLVKELARLVELCAYERWVEPFCGSCVVALNIRPKRALLCDTNVHIIRLFQDIQSGQLNAALVREFLTNEGRHLAQQGEPYFYVVRKRFNLAPTSLDFLFLNRSCFNGVMRFNRSGGFNVPYCHKSERFAPAYVTKITNQVNAVSDVVRMNDWTFRVADFRQTLNELTESDLIYADPPYAGRHTDYFNSWSVEDDGNLTTLLQSAPCRFVYSTWHSNEFRTNEIIPSRWMGRGYQVHTKSHFYHVGPTEELRHPMIEAFITNYPTEPNAAPSEAMGQMALL